MRSVALMRQDVAEEVAEQVGHVALDRAEQEHAERERPREQDADRGIEAQVAPPRDHADRQGGRDRRDRPADVERDPDEIGDDQARKRGVADGVADERQSLEDDEGAHHGAHDADDQRRGQPALHEAVGQRVHEQVDHRRASSW